MPSQLSTNSLRFPPIANKATMPNSGGKQPVSGSVTTPSKSRHTIPSSTFNVHQTSPDGDGFFKALTMGMRGYVGDGAASHDDVVELRELFCNYVCENSVGLEAHAAFKQAGVNELAETVGTVGQWSGQAGDLVPIVAAQATGREVHILEPANEDSYSELQVIPGYNAELPGGVNTSSLPPIFLLKDGDNYAFLEVATAESPTASTLSTSQSNGDNDLVPPSYASATSNPQLYASTQPTLLPNGRTPFFPAAPSLASPTNTQPVDPPSATNRMQVANRAGTKIPQSTQGKAMASVEAVRAEARSSLEAIRAEAMARNTQPVDPPSATNRMQVANRAGTKIPQSTQGKAMASVEAIRAEARASLEAIRAEAMARNTLPDLPTAPSGGLPDLSDLPTPPSDDLPFMPKAPSGGLPDLPTAPSDDLPYMPKAPSGGLPDLPQVPSNDFPDFPTDSPPLFTAAQEEQYRMAIEGVYADITANTKKIMSDIFDTTTGIKF